MAEKANVPIVITREMLKERYDRATLMVSDYGDMLERPFEDRVTKETDAEIRETIRTYGTELMILKLALDGFELKKVHTLEVTV